MIGTFQDQNLNFSVKWINPLSNKKHTKLTIIFPIFSRVAPKPTATRVDNSENSGRPSPGTWAAPLKVQDVRHKRSPVQGALVGFNLAKL
jgi:hypothetical protein